MVVALASAQQVDLVMEDLYDMAVDWILDYEVPEDFVMDEEL